MNSHCLRRALYALLSVVAATAFVGQVQADQVDDAVTKVRALDHQGKGNVEAATALRVLESVEANRLLQLLTAMQDANPLAINYLRGAFDSAADRIHNSGKPLPAAELEKFVLDRSQNARARRLAFEWVTTADKAARERLVPGMIDDPSAELRREAVQRLIDLAKKQFEAKDEPGSLASYREALRGAVDEDQVKEIVAPLRKAGDTIDLAQHFGFVTEWRMIGPFDNREGIGFEAVYPPENELNYDAKYPGFDGEVAWKSVNTPDEYGIFDIAKSISPYKGAVMYAAAEFEAPEPRKVQIRFGTPNAWKIWVNGQPLLALEEYHRGTAMDQYRIDADLKAGKNVILFKILQNEQKEDWAQAYQFQLRVCDASGTAILPAAPKQATKTIDTTKR